jgi:hypothetical protein
MYKHFMVALLVTGCGAGVESSTSSSSEALRAAQPALSCGANQVLICHVTDGAVGDAFEMCVPQPSVAAHVQAGDFEGACSSVGVPPSIPEPPLPEWTPRVPNQPAQLLPPPGSIAGPPHDPTIEAPPSWQPHQPSAPAQVAQPSNGAEAPAWTPQTPTPPAQACSGDGDPCGGDFGGCCGGLTCSWGVCIPD